MGAELSTLDRPEGTGLTAKEVVRVRRRFQRLAELGAPGPNPDHDPPGPPRPGQGPLPCAELADEAAAGPMGVRLLSHFDRDGKVDPARGGAVGGALWQDEAVACADHLVRCRRRDDRASTDLLMGCFDGGRDGFVDLEDLVGMLRTAAGDGGGGRGPTAGERELRAAAAALMREFDADRDGRLGPGELRACVAACLQMRLQGPPPRSTGAPAGPGSATRPGPARPSPPETRSGLPSGGPPVAGPWPPPPPPPPLRGVPAPGGG